MAIAKVSCASRLRAPNDIAPEQNLRKDSLKNGGGIRERLLENCDSDRKGQGPHLLKISSTGSTSSNGIEVTPRSSAGTNSRVSLRVVGGRFTTSCPGRHGNKLLTHFLRT